jgi:hypothetical protein
MFCKPKHQQPTQHVFVGNCGTALGLTEEDIRSFFTQLGAQQTHVPAEASHIYATFPTVEAAQQAVAILSSTPAADLGSRVLTVKYADVREPKASGNSPSSRFPA